MEIASTTAPQLATTQSAATTEAGKMISSDFETFLKMLTVQMQNQDPLNPIESSDYAVQLATFSGVEQQVRTNDLLTAVGAQLGAMNVSGLADLAGWVGMEARAAAPAWFEDTPITLSPDPASGAERAFVIVRDTFGIEMDRIEIPVSDDPLLWAGVGPNGDPFRVGQYTFHLESMAQDAVIAEDQMQIYSEIIEARSEDGQTILVLQGGVEVPATEVDALRAPDVASAG